MNFPERSEIKLQNSWDHMSVQTSGNDYYLVRLRQGLSAFVGHPEYSNILQVAIYPTASKAGLLSQEKLDLLPKIEERMREELEADNEAILAIVSVSPKFQELTFYTSSPEATRKRFSRIKARYDGIDMTECIQPDKTWQLFSDLLARKEKH